MSSAVAAFLRGVERRAAAFAQWQCGDIDTGDAALAAAMTDFGQLATNTPFSDWPRRFWAQLLASPALRAPGVLPEDADGLPALAGLSGGPRVTVLLRMVAGLPEHEAAAVLGVTRATYRLGLQRALPHREDGSPDPDAWRRIADAAQLAIRALPPDRLARLAGLREAALRGQVPPLRRFPLQRAVAPAVPPETLPPAARTHARWLWPAQALVLLAMLAALAWTWRDAWPRGGLADDATIRIEALPDAQAPAATYDAEVGLLTAPDLELLIEADTAVWREDPAFYAWLSTQIDTPADDTRDAHLDDAPDVADGMETTDADL
ncbi:hypothetical protein [Luteimonas sp. 3794]|uniref:hypothetical protein n=1 Tax=Luteimonas sp. 3794 TaxID=2817730 RepID=UPI00286629CD|nr:hypothetical protein [Luteimonas sp. 3794]MDR6991892.1 hypothetical protein [Luteimonas sp. 3794]